MVNPGPYRAYFGCSLLSGLVLVFTGISRIFSDGVLHVAVKEGLVWDSLQFFIFTVSPSPLYASTPQLNS
jgi:hypothetical protein